MDPSQGTSAVALDLAAPVPAGSGRHVVRRQVRILTKNQEAAIFQAQCLYPFSISSEHVADALKLTPRGAKVVCGALVAKGFFRPAGEWRYHYIEPEHRDNERRRIAAERSLRY